MLRKEIQYKDFDGNPRKETFYFNMTDKQLMDLELSEEGGLTVMVKQLSEERDQKKIWDILCRIVDMSYGEKTPDGRGHIKNAKILETFQATQAYSDLVMELVTDSRKGAEFINGLVSADRLAAAQAKAAAQRGQQTLPEPDGIIVVNPDPVIEYYNPEPVRAMSVEEMKAEIARVEGQRYVIPETNEPRV